MVLHNGGSVSFPRESSDLVEKEPKPAQSASKNIKTKNKSVCYHAIIVSHLFLTISMVFVLFLSVPSKVC